MALHRQIRTSGPYVIPLKRAKLYLDDIQDILSAIEGFAKEHPPEEGRRSGLTLQADKAVADSVEDLREATAEEMERVSIRLIHPLISVDLWNWSADIRTENDDTESRALAEDLAAFVHQHPRQFFDDMRVSAFLPAVASWIFAVFNLVQGIGRSHSHQPNASDYLWAIGFFILGAVSFFFLNRIPAKPGVIVVPERRAEKKRISSRARRDIIVAIGAAVISAVILGIAGLWAGIFVK